MPLEHVLALLVTAGELGYEAKRNLARELDNLFS
jgi:hypothetical protein